MLSVDRTNWQFGSSIFNILTLGVVHQGVAFPLLWVMLDKKGNFNSRKRSDLLDRFFEVFSEVEVAYLTADREFIGVNWFEYLLEQAALPFRICLRESDKLDQGWGVLKAKVVFAHLQINQHQILR